jgi:hypothetical protein
MEDARDTNEKRGKRKDAIGLAGSHLRVTLMGFSQIGWSQAPQLRDQAYGARAREPASQCT